jgi:hypothetical protein
MVDHDYGGVQVLMCAQGRGRGGSQSAKGGCYDLGGRTHKGEGADAALSAALCNAAAAAFEVPQKRT